MKALTSVVSLVLALFAWAPPVSADTANARCEFIKEGDTKEKASGPCSFSQRQGYVDIDLRDGKTFSLSPANKADHFKDQKGHKVVRTASGDEHVYKWEDGRKIIVTFESQQERHGGRHSEAGGDTPDALRDLVGGHRVGGEVDDALTERGYRHVRDSESGKDVWSNWKNHATKQCVTVHFDGDRRVRSIVNAPAFDCK